MCADHSFKSVSEEASGKLNPNLMRLVRRRFSGRKALDDVIAEDTAGFAPALLGSRHLPVCRLRGGTVQGGLVQPLLRFVPAHGILDHAAKRGLFLVGHIGYAVVQPRPDKENFRDCHGSEDFDLTPYLRLHGLNGVNVLLVDMPRPVGHPRNLVDIVANGRQLTAGSQRADRAG